MFFTWIDRKGYSKPRVCSETTLILECAVPIVGPVPTLTDFVTVESLRMVRWLLWQHTVCKIEVFHFKCLKLNRAPKGKANGTVQTAELWNNSKGRKKKVIKNLKSLANPIRPQQDWIFLLLKLYASILFS